MALTVNDLKSFVTGSHAYGVPNSKSDIDLVVMVSKEDLALLKDIADEGFRSDGMYESAMESACLRFGRMNLLVCTDLGLFGVWKRGTKELKAKSKKGRVSRDEAVRHFHKLREEYYLKNPRKE